MGLWSYDRSVGLGWLTLCTVVELRGDQEKCAQVEMLSTLELCETMLLLEESALRLRNMVVYSLCVHVYSPLTCNVVSTCPVTRLCGWESHVGFVQALDTTVHSFGRDTVERAVPGGNLCSTR